MLEANKIIHVILTRFNCRYIDKEFPARIEPTWLDERFDLFERYCLPTMVAQTSQDFEWVIFFDEHTPESYINRAQALLQYHPNMHIRYLPYYSGKHLKDDLVELLAGRCDWLVSTRLDNDDGLHATFVERVQREIRAGCREAINFSNGILLGERGIYLSRQYSNAFLSLSEPFATFETVLCTPHKDMEHIAPVRDIKAPPLWLQVIHGGNVSNKLRGKRILRRDLPNGFESIVEFKSVPSVESRLMVQAENMTLALVWAARDSATQFYRYVRGRHRKRS